MCTTALWHMSTLEAMGIKAAAYNPSDKDEQKFTSLGIAKLAIIEGYLDALFPQTSACLYTVSIEEIRDTSERHSTGTSYFFVSHMLDYPVLENTRIVLGLLSSSLDFAFLMTARDR